MGGAAERKEYKRSRPTLVRITVADGDDAFAAAVRQSIGARFDLRLQHRPTRVRRGRAPSPPAAPPPPPPPPPPPAPRPPPSRPAPRPRPRPRVRTAPAAKSRLSQMQQTEQVARLYDDAVARASASKERLHRMYVDGTLPTTKRMPEDVVRSCTMRLSGSGSAGRDTPLPPPSRPSVSSSPRLHIFDPAREAADRRMHEGLTGIKKQHLPFTSAGVSGDGHQLSNGWTVASFNRMMAISICVGHDRRGSDLVKVPEAPARKSKAPPPPSPQHTAQVTDHVANQCLRLLSRVSPMPGLGSSLALTGMESPREVEQPVFISFSEDVGEGEGDQSADQDLWSQRSHSTRSFGGSTRKSAEGFGAIFGFEKRNSAVTSASSPRGQRLSRNFESPFLSAHGHRRSQSSQRS